MKKHIFFGILSLLVFACNNNNIHKTVIVIAPQAAKPIEIAAQDLREDLLTSIQTTVSIHASFDDLPKADIYFIVGQVSELRSTALFDKSTHDGIIEKSPGDRGSMILRTTVNQTPAVILSSSDVQGTQYAVYEYSKQILLIDPLAYWTGSEPKTVPIASISDLENMIIAPPVVPLLVYFENDVDELMNLKEPMLEYDWEVFTNMIDSLVRLKYNGIEMFDMLGRVEFYDRPAYTQRFPDYQLDVEYLEKQMQYVHDKGMYLQFDMMQGRQLRTMSREASNCWSNYKQDWIDGWRFYLSETPLKNIDIFALRPRNQVFDWSYQSSCGENPVDVFNEVYAALDTLVDEFKPGATRVNICYSDGMKMFNEGFSPPKSFITAWSDDGWGTFKYLPDSTKGFKFGTYMHAGYWKNHDVMDPYPELVESEMRMMYQDYQATEYMMVNGQTFRPFLLNIEAYAESANMGLAFEAEEFYRQWTNRYFGEQASPYVIKAFQLLHQAHEDHAGYVEMNWHIKLLQAYLANVPGQQPGKEQFEVTIEMVEQVLPATAPKVALIEQAIKIANDGALVNTENPIFYHDHVQLPLMLFMDLLQYNEILIEMTRLKLSGELTQGGKAEFETLLSQAREQLDVIYDRRLQGDKDPKWATWYDPKKRRPNNGFPTQEALDKIEAHLLSN